MTWANTWNNILAGGPSRWKVDNLAFKKQALDYITAHAAITTTSSSSSLSSSSNNNNNNNNKLNILCPLAGDDPFVQYAWSQGHDVTAIDLVPAAVKVMRAQFGTGTGTGADDGDDDNEWTCEVQSSTSAVWKHSSGRATLYQGDMMAKRSELNQKFDVIYDKDSFGALDKSLREPFCQRLSEYCKDGAIVYIEVKNKESGRDSGPPWHVDTSDLMQDTSFGTHFEHSKSLGGVYPLSMQGMSQTGHILKRQQQQ